MTDLHIHDPSTNYFTRRQQYSLLRARDTPAQSEGHSCSERGTLRVRDTQSKGHSCSERETLLLRERDAQSERHSCSEQKCNAQSKGCSCSELRVRDTQSGGHSCSERETLLLSCRERDAQSERHSCSEQKCDAQSKGCSRSQQHSTHIQSKGQSFSEKGMLLRNALPQSKGTPSQNKSTHQ